MESHIRSYRFGFNGQEKLNEAYGEGNAYDFGARIYDPRIGRWMKTDPQASKYPYLSPYVSMGDNPLIYIDPGGETIVVPETADREPILKMINSRALGKFDFNDAGELYLVKATGDKTKYSKYYQDKLVAAINDPDKIEIDLTTEFYNPRTRSMANLDRVGRGGNTISVPWTETKKDYNANGDVIGITVTEHHDSKICVSGNANTDFFDTKGNPLRSEGADILMHELVGHAIPISVIGDTGNAVENENKVRKELGPGNDQQRAPEPDHLEIEEAPKN
jgi:RHS repeat-associated protein